jgi:hypothetical protein
MNASITISSKTMIPLLVRNQQRGALNDAIKIVCSRFSTLPARNALLNCSLDESSELRESLSPIQLTMCPGNTSGAYRTSSFDDTSQHYNSLDRKNAAVSVSPQSSSSAAVNVSSNDIEFDPILDIRSLNPLIFESNYDLEDYGPSFREHIMEHQPTMIREWRIHHESGMY